MDKGGEQGTVGRQDCHASCIGSVQVSHSCGRGPNGLCPISQQVLAQRSGPVRSRVISRECD